MFTIYQSQSDDIPGIIRSINNFARQNDVSDLNKIDIMLDNIIKTYTYKTFYIPYVHHHVYKHICQQIGECIIEDVGNIFDGYTKVDYLLDLISNYVSTNGKRTFIYILLFIKLMSPYELNGYIHRKKITIAMMMLSNHKNYMNIIIFEQLIKKLNNYNDLTITAITYHQEEVALLLSKYDTVFWENNLDLLLEKAVNKILLNVVKLLINKGAVLQNAMSLCYHNVNSEIYIEMLKCVIPCIADINKIDSTHYPYETILHTALFFKSDIIKLLLDNGADPNIKNHYDDTVFHTLIRFCSVDVLRLMLPKCTDINAVNKSGHNLLFDLRDSDIEKAELLIKKGINCNITNINGDTLLHTYCHLKYYKLFDLVSKHMASEYINKINKKGETILHIVKINNEIDINNYVKIMNIINETTINTPNNKNLLPIQTAIKFKRYDIAEILAERTTNLNIGCKLFGSTPLHYAVQHELEKVVETLLKNSADPFALDNKNQFPLYYAYNNLVITKLLISKMNEIDANKIYIYEHSIKMLNDISNRTHVINGDSFYTFYLELLSEIIISKNKFTSKFKNELTRACINSLFSHRYYDFAYEKFKTVVEFDKIIIENIIAYFNNNGYVPTSLHYILLKVSNKYQNKCLIEMVLILRGDIVIDKAKEIIDQKYHNLLNTYFDSEIDKQQIYKKMYKKYRTALLLSTIISYHDEYFAFKNGIYSLWDYLRLLDPRNMSTVTKETKTKRFLNIMEKIPLEIQTMISEYVINPEITSDGVVNPFLIDISLIKILEDI